MYCFYTYVFVLAEILNITLWWKPSVVQWEHVVESYELQIDLAFASLRSGSTLWRVATVLIVGVLRNCFPLSFTTVTTLQHRERYVHLETWVQLFVWEESLLIYPITLKLFSQQHQTRSYARVNFLMCALITTIVCL